MAAPETIIGSNISIEGDITGTESLVIHGQVRGRVEVKEQVVVAQGGQVEADIQSQSVEVAGFVQGNVHCTDRIEVKSGGRLVGDIRAARVLIADGAAFKGNVNMVG
jgi:cytoskeletal protein CcmA (bactofilin family)